MGALNVDYIASASRLSARSVEQVAESAARFEWNTEGRVDEGTLAKVIERLGASSLDASLGGSAWLAVSTLAQMAVGISLGFVGVAGRIEAPGLSFTRQFDALGIDRTWVARRPAARAGICLSYLEDLQRVMLTHPGANYQMAAHLATHGEQIARYLSTARVVHVTSFLDADTPPQMVQVLSRARRLNPDLVVSFDPGGDWADHPTPPVQDLLALTDLLFATYREFKALGEYELGEPDALVARRILDKCRPSATVFVTKRYDAVEAFRGSPSGVLAQRFQLRRPAREGPIEDATGAGDVFVAGVLAALTSRQLQTELGAFVGLSLSRHRTDHPDLSDDPAALRRPAPPALRKGFLQVPETLTGPGSRPRAVLISHDGTDSWQPLHELLRDVHHLPVYTVNQADVRSQDRAARLRWLLGRCGFAVCVLSAARTMADGARRAHEDVIHQVGILQGHYGFERVAILAEDGCEAPSNIAGLIRVDFAPGRIEHTFFELQRMLDREGLLRRRPT